MRLDSFELLEALLKENRELFDWERTNLPKSYQIKNGLLLYDS
jgi:hypothetical protein